MRTQSKHSFKGTRRWHSGGTEWARDGVTLLCADRRLRSPSDVLAAAGELPDWSVGRCWDRGDQLARHLFGFAGPCAMGYLKDLTGNFTVGLLLLAGCAVLGAAVVMSLRIDAKREQSLGEVALAH